jgi:hypothetical protein
LDIAGGGLAPNRRVLVQVVGVLCIAMAAAEVPPRAAHAQTTTTTSVPVTGTESTSIGPGISVTEARRTHLKGPVLVTGYLLVRPHQPIRLCDELAHARTTRCAGASIEVRGLRPSERDALATVHRAGAGTRWSSDQVQVLGEIRKQELRVQQHANA